MAVDLKAFYDLAGGDYEAVMGRLRSEERVAKFVRMFMMDDNYQRLMGALETADVDTAFRATHTLKGIAGDMGFTTLSQAASAACEGFRSGDFAAGAARVMPVADAYGRVQAAAERYL